MENNFVIINVFNIIHYRINIYIILFIFQSEHTVYKNNNRYAYSLISSNHIIKGVKNNYKINNRIILSFLS